MGVYVPIEDVRTLLKLVGEAREIVDAGASAETHVLAGLSRLAGAEGGIFFLVEHLCTPAPLTVMEYADHGFTEGGRRRILDFYRTTSGMADPMLCSVLRARWRERNVTLRRTDVVPSRAWQASMVHNELHRPEGFDDVIVSVRLPEGAGDGLNALVLKRAAGAPPFSVEQREILHLFRCEFDWVFRRERRPPPAPAEGLTPREQETLSLLLTDASEKLIAARLGISPHTVHTHVKRLYRKLGVTSRAALMAASPGGPGATRPRSGSSG